jgi:hypothetical protein
VNGILVEHSAAALARAIARLRADRTYAAALGAGGRRQAEQQWSLGASIDRLEHQLSEALALRASGTLTAHNPRGTG